MSALIHSELRKLTGTRLAVGLLLGALALVGLALGFTLWGPEGPGLEVEGAPGSVETVTDVVSLLGVAVVSGTFALILGVTMATGEFRHQTASTTFLTEPRRWRVCVAKTVVAAVAGVVYAVVALAMALGMIWFFTAMEGTSLPTGGELWEFLGMTVLVGVLNAILGVGVGSALRSQVGAIVSVLLWLFVVESMIAGLLPSLAGWTPFAAGNMMVTPDGTIGVATATAVATGYSLLAVVVGTWLTEQRDVA